MKNSLCILIGQFSDPILFICFEIRIRLPTISTFLTKFVNLLCTFVKHVVKSSSRVSSCPIEVKEENPRLKPSPDLTVPDFNSPSAGFIVFSARATTPNAWVEAPRSTWLPSWSTSSCLIQFCYVFINILKLLIGMPRIGADLLNA